MAKKVTIPINFGRMDRIAAKHAPFGVLKRVENMRHREIGGFGMRNGYAALDMGTASSDLVAYDLHEYGGRLIALGTSTGDQYPTDIWEYTANPTEAWRQSDRASPRSVLSPFTNLRSVTGIPHPEGGVALLDSCAGAGHVCLIYRANAGSVYNAMVISQDTDQVKSFERGGNAFGSYLRAVVTFAAGSFYVLGVKADNSIEIQKFTPGTSVVWTTFAAVDALNANTVSALDIVAVGNASTALLAVAFDRVTAINLSIKVFQSNGSQLGSTISLAGTTTTHLTLEADQTANQINLCSRDSGTMNLRTWNFAGTLLNGPTALAAGDDGQLVRIANGNADGQGRVLVSAVNDTSNGVTIQYWNPSTHSLGPTVQVDSAEMQTRLLDVSSAGAFSHYQLVAFGGLTGPKMSTGFKNDATNALWTVGPSVAHMTTRNYLSGKSIHETAGLFLDSSTGAVVWTAGENDGSNLTMPSIALLDLKSTARRQSAKFGGLLYLAGPTPLVYDGRFACEPGFEVAGVVSVTPSVAAGSLTPSATYSYICHFEFTLSDGSIIEGPPSLPVNVTMGASDNTNTVLVQTPHAVAVALGGGLYGANITAVVSRTEWSPATTSPTTGLPGAQLSIFRRAVTAAVPVGLANYGSTLSIVDTISDINLASQAPVYTQGERGELSGTLEHNTPQACSYITATEGRILTGGLFRAHEFQISKEAFLGSCFNWSEFSSFFGIVAERIKGVHALDGSKFIFTDDEIFAVEPGEPDDLGQGALGRPIRVPTPSGLKDWRSLLEGPDGLWFQLDDDKIFRIPRGGGSPQWMGQDIIKLLASFPTVTAASRHRRDNCALFALNSAANTSAVIAVRDFELQTWLVDIPPLQASSGISAMVVCDRTVAYVSGGTVYVQSPTAFVDNGATGITCLLETQPIYPFELGGYGTIDDLMVTAEYRGACTLAVRISLDDGITYSSLPSFTLSGLTTGQTVQRKWALPNNNATSICVEVTVTPSGGSEGLVINQIDLLAEEVPGTLKELNPGEMS